MKYTVVMPCYASSKTIAKALDSLAAQTYSDFNVIIVDDASPDFDETNRQIELFNERLVIKVLRNSERSNGAFSRNRAIEIVESPYVAFLDSDDTWVEDRLESANSLIHSQYDDNFLIYGKFELVQQDNFLGPILPFRPIQANELVTEYVFSGGHPMQTSTFICPTNIAKFIMFDERYHRHQDTDFVMRAQKENIRFIFQEKKISNYYFNKLDLKNRIEDNRISSSFCETWLKEKDMFFNVRSRNGYQCTVYSRVLYLEKSKLQGFIVFLKNFFGIGVFNIFSIVKVKFLIFVMRYFKIRTNVCHSHLVRKTMVLSKK